MKYWVDFSGYVCVEAENEGDAERKSWNEFRGSVSISEPFSDYVWEIEGIEERTDGDLLDTVYGNKDAAEVALDGVAASCTYNPNPNDLEDFWNNK